MKVDIDVNGCITSRPMPSPTVQNQTGAPCAPRRERWLTWKPHIAVIPILGLFNVTVPKRHTPTAMQQWVQFPVNFCSKTTGGRQRKTRPASADRTARRQFQVVFPVINGSFSTNVIAHLHGLSMDLTVGRTVGPTVDSTVG